MEQDRRSGKLGSTARRSRARSFYRPGIQAWYNQFIDVDPADANHVFVGLEEVYETEDGGSHWTTIGPYWNFDFHCWSVVRRAEHLPADDAPRSALDRDRRRHASTSATTAASTRGRCAARVNAQRQRHRLAEPEREHAHAAVLLGRRSARSPGGVAVSGGLQDNGGSLLLPEDLTGAGKMGSPFGGDGGDTLVDPNDGCRIVQEYVFLAMEVTENCGRSDGTVRVGTRHRSRTIRSRASSRRSRPTPPTRITGSPAASTSG